MEGNASVNIPASGAMMPLHIASVEGHLAICQVDHRASPLNRSSQVLAANACLMLARDASGQLAVQLAQARQHYHVVEWMLLASRWLPLQARRYSSHFLPVFYRYLFKTLLPTVVSLTSQVAADARLPHVIRHLLR